MDANKQLDIALEFLSQKDNDGKLVEGGYKDFYKFQLFLKRNGVDDNNIYTPIAERLQKDGYAMLYPDGRKSNEPITAIKATFDGLILNEQGGYMEINRISKREDGKIDAMQLFQKISADKMLYATIVLAIGTIGLLLWEILKFFLEKQKWN